MPVVFDSSFLVPLLDAKVKLGETADSKLEFLLEDLSKTRQKIIIPTPALSEVLVGAGSAAPQYLDYLNSQRYFEIASFDKLAAVEAAELIRTAKMQGDKKSGSSSSWQKVKFDQQIVAIARVKNASCIFSNDHDIELLVGGSKIRFQNLESLPLPPVESQNELFSKKQLLRHLEDVQIAFIPFLSEFIVFR